jgi:hypothetical protein
MFAFKIKNLEKTDAGQIVPKIPSIRS